MSNTDRYTGHDLVIKWVYSGGTVDLSSEQRSLSSSEEVGDADATAGNDDYSVHLPTFADSSCDVELLDLKGSAGTARWAALRPRTEGTLYWYPSGTAINNTYHYVPAYIQKRDREVPYDDVVPISVTFQFQGEPTDSFVT